REVTQDVTGRVHASGRAPHPEPHPQIVRPGQGGREGLQAVVPPGATAPLELERPEVDVHLVVHDDDPRRWNLVEPCQPGHRATGQIHVRTRFDQYRRYTAQAGLDDLRVGPVHLPALVLGGRQGIHHHETGIVAVTGVLGPGVTQPDDQPALCHVL